MKYTVEGSHLQHTYIYNIIMFFQFKCYLLITLVITLTTADRISKEKCKEYAELVYDLETSPVLRMGIRKNAISHCGIIETPLIVGGTKAKRKEFPHMVVIGFNKTIEEKYSNKFEISWDCGGIVISEFFVLTAGHCLHSASWGPAIRVRAGMTKINKPEHGYQERIILERIKHPNYTRPSRYHDIGLLKLEEPFEFNGYVRPACLETQHELSEKSFIASGFGKTSWDEEKGSNVLMKVQLDYISKEVCEKTYKYDIGGRELPSGIIPNFLCAGVMAGNKDTCQGDSGGPLQRVLSEPHCMYSIVGVTSFGKFCGFQNTPAVYSRVSSYVDWVESIVWPEN